MGNIFAVEIHVTSQQSNHSLSVFDLNRIVGGRAHAVLKMLSILLFYILGVVFYRFSEGWSVLNCVYFVTISISTVGYGDVTPTHNGSKVFTVFYILTGLVCIFCFFNDAIDAVIDKMEKEAVQRLDNDSTDLKEPHGAKFAISILCILAVLFVGTMFVKYNEGWTFVDSFYWSFITSSTVGFGDLPLQYDSTKIFAIFYSLIAVATVAGAIGNFTATKLEIAAEKKKLELLNKRLNLDTITDLDKDGNGVSEVEFLSYMLAQTCNVDHDKDIKPWLERFKELDRDNSGFLTAKDLKYFVREETEKVLQTTSKCTSSKYYTFESQKRTQQNSRRGNQMLKNYFRKAVLPTSVKIDDPSTAFDSFSEPVNSTDPRMGDTAA